MNTGLIVFGILLLAFLVWKMLKPQLVNTPIQNDIYPPPQQKGDIVNTTSNKTTITPDSPAVVEDIWWKTLNSFQQLQLALLLSKKALPVWEKYTSAYDTNYRDSPTGPVVKINSSLLQIAIDEMALASITEFPGDKNEKIIQYYYNFVGPVIAMQDGIWMPSYPVKKIFLAVYYILKSIVEQDTIPDQENFLSTSISQSLDCIDMSKLYSSEEVTSFWADYQNKTGA